MAESPNIVGIRAPDVSKQLVQLLKDALEIAESGKMTGVVVVFTERDAKTSARVFRQGENMLMLLGALTVAADDLSAYLKDE